MMCGMSLVGLLDSVVLTSSTRAVVALSLSVLLFKNTGDPFFKQNLSQRPVYKLMGEKLSLHLDHECTFTPHRVPWAIFGEPSGP